MREKQPWVRVSGWWQQRGLIDPKLYTRYELRYDLLLQQNCMLLTATPFVSRESLFISRETRVFLRKTHVSHRVGMFFMGKGGT